MDFKSLSYFVCAAETLNFTQAARNCNISQTAMSLSIAKMEKELGFQLFERNSRVMRLTPAGRDFFEWARQTMHSYERTVQTEMNIASGYSGVVKIASASCFDALWLISQLQPFRKRFSDVRIEHRIVDPKLLLGALRGKDIDAVVSPPCQYMGCEDLELQDIAHFPMILVTGRNHPLTKYGVVPKNLLERQHCIILTYQNSARAEAYFNLSLEKNGIRFRDMRQMNHLDEILISLIDSDSVAFLPAFVSGYLNNFCVARTVEDCDMQIKFTFCRLKSNKNPTLNALQLALQQSYARNG
jgi:DNA-binding transcriptional LysR family regulator